MIWLDIKELETGLKNGALSDKEALNYLLANLILYSVVPYIGGNDSTNKWLIALEIVVVIAVTVIGTKKTFDVNSAGDNRDYFKRFLSLSFVTGIRLLALVLVVAIPIGIIVYLVDKNLDANENTKDLFEVALTAVSGIVYYFMLISSFKRVSQ
jgi:prepilin signal peptidase PulO-like enzyme (type II secretory pathway)